MSLMSIFLTSGNSNATWNPLKSPGGVSRTSSIVDAKIDTLPIFPGFVKIGNGTSNGKSEKLRRIVWGEGYEIWKLLNAPSGTMKSLFGSPQPPNPLTGSEPFQNEDS